MPELHVRAVSARNLHDAQTFGKQDPYCKISVGHRTFKTRVHDNGGRNPVWNDKFVFEVADMQLSQLVIEIWDSNYTSDDYIGTCRLPMSIFASGQVIDQWYPVNYRNQQRGEINLRVQMLGIAGAHAPPAYGHQQPYAAPPPAYQQPAPPAYAQPSAPGYPSAPPAYGQQPAYNGGYAQQQQQQQIQQQQQQLQQQQQAMQQQTIQQQQMQLQQQQAQLAQQQAQMAAQASRPMYAPPPPVYAAPQPMYAAPPPVMMAPPPVIVGPPPVVMGGPVVYGAPAPVMYGGGYGGGYGDGYDNGGGVVAGAALGLAGGVILGAALSDDGGFFD
ncbi:hypothetical protein SPRG_05925 [Saprolegnia parasitica CBS 223.65]|uniref:C2 domain-containing protein n=1 Tax=Saprolegnia parasitica (strain CBS 223.65) TaxID=695850 RepID=A0A067CFV6_SAPPC|nr:hypothetical protein SPRG_05925 [Saprolegnia parasitica CBS 223.65]KDO29388.1 hypothetical protein SPRG_05925 [Saprolegnia parasitica CBS 223.65]|eukprot:XP_012199891.1 hypothetical protein SPRG_05925 [Saprolegnia parasitica CBS 223.65]